MLGMYFGEEVDLSYRLLEAGYRIVHTPHINVRHYESHEARPLGRRIRKSELQADNGYNTYLKPGLPRGPIANPGKASIAAVLNPSETKDLYFVANGQGGHVFSATLEAQNANVAKWFALRRARGEM